MLRHLAREERRHLRGARVVNQRINGGIAAQFLFHRADPGFIGEIGHQNIDGHAVARAQVGGEGFQAILAAGDQDQVGTARGKAIGIDGLILPDIPYEEKDEFDGICKQYDVDLISLIAPTSHERISMIANDASGFIYCVSSLGVTGTRTKITTDIGAMVDLVKKAKDIPCAVGFGISTPEQAKQMAEKSDGVIVGSAIVKLCAQYGKDCVPYVRDYVKSMKDAMR